MASCMVGVVALTLSSAVAADLEATTEYECVVTTYEDPSNGAGPLWCYGAPLVVRHGTDVFISTLETGEGVPPLCNTRWRVFRITDQGPELLTEDATYRHREPCPLGVGASGTLYLSVNPSTQPPGTQYGPCDPHIIALEPSATPVGAREVRPPWPEDATFTDHS